MSSLFFWIIILSFVVPMAMRAYRRSVARRDRDQGFPGQFPGPGQYPGQNQLPGPDQYPGYGPFPGSAGPQSRQPRDGYTQQDYFSGGFRQPPFEGQPPYGAQQPYGGQQLPPQQYGQPPMPDPRYGPPQEPPFQQQPFPQQGFQQEGRGQASGPATPPPPSAPQGFRARKMAELDQQYSNGELSMEEYMKRRGDIMNG
ncbi:hypothetical protein [Arthrobacter sp. SLBN-53]|uniref:hypothetical protein n=1 Tax=unclassified Pseudarthrobacter TaxID=2647000 RepID=UPI00114F2BB2